MKAYKWGAIYKLDYILH